MRRVIKIILGILLIIAIILVVAWFRARHAAQQQGTASPSFREFLGLGSVTPSKQTVTPGTDLSSDFTQQDAGNSTTDTTDGTTGGGTATSQFTSGPISPTQNTGLGTTTLSSSGSGKNSTLSGGSAVNSSGSSVPGTSSGSSTPAAAPASTTTPLSQCSDADITIQFTPDEINRLNALQNRFYAIAGNLHTDADVRTEISNHDQFKAKADQITELYNYCVAQSPKITAPLFASRITTPFWRDASRDGSGYWWNRPNGVTFIDLTNNDNFPQDPTNPMMSQASIEQIFKLNLW